MRCFFWIACFVLFSAACNKQDSSFELVKIAPTLLEDSLLSKAVADFGQLQVKGNKIFDKNGNAVVLRGMSLFWSQWIGKYYNAETVSWLKSDWQCNVVRAAMAVENGGYLANKNIEKAKVFAVIDAAIKEGIYVIVDWHDHNAEKHIEESKAFFAEVAQKYGKYPNIIYETYNEPLNVSWTSVLKPYHEAVIAEIRKYDTKNLVICGTRNWSQNVNDVIDNKIADGNVAYTLHFYADTHKQPLRDLAMTALNADIPLFVTEYGTTNASANGSINVEESEKWWKFCEDNKISYCNWSIADKEELASALKPNTSVKGGWTTSDITPSGSMVRKQIRLKN